MPIIMMADRQTTGGYTKIGTVIGPDLAKLAQAKPGDIVNFKQVSYEDAVNALKAEQDSYVEIKTVGMQKNNKSTNKRRYKVKINGTVYIVDVEEDGKCVLI